jgi:hypothetical protein
MCHEFYRLRGMRMQEASKASLAYWAIALVLLLWGALGLSIYIDYFFFVGPS